MNANNHYHEMGLIDTVDGIQCKVYANSHPPGMVIVKPKYVPIDLIPLVGMKKRFLFSQCQHRFNFFTKPEYVIENLKLFREKFPEYFYDCSKHQNWFCVVPENKIKKFYDSKKGLQELMRVPYSDLDDYLKAVQEFVTLLTNSGVPLEKFGIAHSTLLGNYTPGKSDMDIIVFGKQNGWKVLNFLETAEHPKLSWKSAEGWAKYYTDRVVSKQFTKEEYVFNMVRKKDDGLFAGNVFSVFCVEEPHETWYDWTAQHEPLGTVKIRGTVNDHSHSHLRPGYYDLSSSKILDGYADVPIKRIVVWSRPFNLQAKAGENIEACGLLEKVTTSQGEYYQIVIGYFDTYTCDRGEQEYLKVWLEE